MSAPWNSWGNYHDSLALFGISKKKKDRIRWNSGAIIITDERSTKRSARLFGRNCERRSLTSPGTNNTPSLKKAATNAIARGTKLKWNRRQQLIQRAHRIFSRMWPDDYLQNTVTWSKRSRLSREVISTKTNFPTKGKSISTVDWLQLFIILFIYYFQRKSRKNEVILQEDDEIHDCDHTSLPDQPLGHSDGTGREIADERLTQSMSLTEDEHHNEQTEQPLIKRALTEDGLLEQMSWTEDKHLKRTQRWMDREIADASHSVDVSDRGWAS